MRGYTIPFVVYLKIRWFSVVVVQTIRLYGHFFLFVFFLNEHLVSRLCFSLSLVVRHLRKKTKKKKRVRAKRHLSQEKGGTRPAAAGPLSPARRTQG